MVSPGISIHRGEVKQAAELGKAIIGDVELFAQLADKPVVAITGTNGKSTVSTLVAEIIRAAGYRVGLGGNIGTPALDLLNTKVDYYVLELSSYQLETTDSLQASVASILNLSEDHLDRYDSYQHYIRAKLRIYPGAKYCVSNADDELSWHDDADVRFSLDAQSPAEFKLCAVEQQTWLCHGGQALVPVSELSLQGRHNWANCLAAMAICHCLGIAHDAMLTALKSFSGIAHRSQPVATIDSVTWVNDSKATNVGAAIASIEGRSEPVILIAGGQSKGADMALMTPVLRSKVKQVFLLGEDADLMQQAWQGSCPIERVADMAEAVTRASQLAEAGDCVLLAPACASFDMYEKFEARGDHFSELVLALGAGHG